MTIHDFYQSVSYFWNSDSEIIRVKIEKLVMIKNVLHWNDELTQERFELIKQA